MHEAYEFLVRNWPLLAMAALEFAQVGVDLYFGVWWRAALMLGAGYGSVVLMFMPTK